MARYAFSKISNEVIEIYRNFLGERDAWQHETDIVPLNVHHDEFLISMMILVENTTDFGRAENKVRTILDSWDVPHDLVVAEDNGSTGYDVFVAVYYGTQ
jgi:hypothetical protein